MFNPVIKWSGSKRSQAKELLKLFPEFKNYYEPFLGGGSVLYVVEGEKAFCGDICKPLIELWKLIQKDPKKLINSYTKDWNILQKEGYQTYYKIRDRFNKHKKAEDLFFLSRTCVNGLIRFNQKGEFNNSFHLTRRGIDPKRIEKIILDWSKKIQKVKFYNKDYRETTKSATSKDLIYLDPPYFNTKGRYYGKIDYEVFVEFLRDLNKRKVKFILSYDGMRGNIKYLKDLPKELYKRHLLLNSGNSSFRKVIDKKSEMVRESVYLNF